MQFQNPPKIGEVHDWIIPNCEYGIFDGCGRYNSDILDFYKNTSYLCSDNPLDLFQLNYLPISNLRFFVMSSKFIKYGMLASNYEENGIVTLNINSFFRIIDIQTLNDVTQIVLLHFPYRAIDSFTTRKTLKYGGNNNDFFEEIRTLAKEKFIESFSQPKYPEFILNDNIFKIKNLVPIGIDLSKNNIMTNKPRRISDFSTEEKHLYSAFRKLSGDTTDINQIFS